MNHLSFAFRLASLSSHSRLPFAKGVLRSTESICRRQAAKLATRLRGRVTGRPVLILGSGPALNAAAAEAFAALGRRFFVIGVNRTFYRSRLDLFLSAYPSEHALALLHRHRILDRVQIRPESYIPVIRGSVAWQRILLGSREVCRELGDGTPPVVRTKRNVALGATDLAVRLGARDVYFLGVEQNNQAHYFDYDPALKERIREDIKRFIGRDQAFSADHPYGAVTRELDRLQRSVEDVERTPFYESDHADTFAALFRELDAYGARFFSVGPDTVVARAGARVVSLDDLEG